MQDDQTPIEAEIVQSDTPSDTSSTTSATTFVPAAVDAHLDLTGIINNYVAQVENAKKEAAKFKDMLDSMLVNDSVYQNQEAAVKEAQKAKNATKKQILKMPQAADLAARVQDYKDQIKEINSTLPEYLQEYEKTTGSRQIEGLDGQIREIVFTARLVKKNDFNP